MTGLVSLARKHKHVAATHYDGCEADHIGCLVNKLADEIERQRVENERLRAALIDIARQETTGPYKWQSVVEHLCEIAREALEGEP